MSSSAFHIHWTLSEREPPDDPEPFEDASALALAFEAFVARHEGTVTLVFDAVELELELDRDIGMVLDTLPEFIERIREDEPAELHFDEQGTDLTLAACPRDGVVLIAPRSGAFSRPPLAALPPELDAGDVSEFVAEWCRFLRALLGRLELAAPSLAGDDAYRAYRRRLDRVCEGPGPH